MSRDEDLELFAGAFELISDLHAAGRRLGVATGKSRPGLNRSLAASGLDAFFHITRCADECFSKPHPAMLLDIMSSLGVDPERALMIGDTTHDLQMARNAGIAAVAVAFGAHPRRELLAERPLACVEDFPELEAWLQSHG